MITIPTEPTSITCHPDEFPFTKQMREQYNFFKSFLARNGREFTHMDAYWVEEYGSYLCTGGAKTGKLKVSFTVYAPDFEWQKYEAPSKGSGQNYVTLLGKKMKTSNFLYVTPEEQDFMFSERNKLLLSALTLEEALVKFGLHNKATINSNGIVDIDGNAYIHPGKSKTILPLKFRTVTGEFMVSNSSLQTLDGFPKSAQRITILRIEAAPSGYIPLLFSVTQQTQVSTEAIQMILNDGREANGKMPRELIPGKINQLRDMD
jgi:hypothetical protein